MLEVCNGTRTRAVVSALAIAVTLAASSFAACAQSAQKDIKVGILLSLTGNNAETGRDSKRGIDLAIEDLTRSGRLKSPARIVLTEVDDASGSNQAVTAVQRLASENVSMIVGGSVSNTVRAALPVAQRAKLPFVVVNTFSAGLTKVADIAFQVSAPTNEFNKDEVRTAVKAFGSKRAAIIWAQDNPTTVAFRDDFLAALKEVGVPVVVDEPMKALDTDYSAQLRKAQAANADLLIPNFNAGQNAALIKQAHSLDYRPKTIGHVGDLGPSFITVGGNEVVGHIANSGYFPDADTPEIKSFVKEYTAKYGTPPTAPAALAYQSMSMAGEAIARLVDRNVEVTPEASRAELLALGERSSVLGASGKAQFVDRVLKYDAFLLILDKDLKWRVWKP